MLAKTLVVFYVWSPDIFVLIFIITLFQALFILLCQIKHYHTIPYHVNKIDIVTGYNCIHAFNKYTEISINFPMDLLSYVFVVLFI